jgi:hypothetical protein
VKGVSVNKLTAWFYKVAARIAATRGLAESCMTIERGQNVAICFHPMDGTAKQLILEDDVPRNYPRFYRFLHMIESKNEKTVAT